MNCKREVIAAWKGLGYVSFCRSCGQVQLSLGAVTIRLEAPAYLQLVGILNSSVSAFETSKVAAEERPVVLTGKDFIQ